MTGAQLLAFLRRRLGETGAALSEARKDDLLDYLTAARDEVKAEIARVAPERVAVAVALDQDPTDPWLYRIPGLMPDPMRIVRVESDLGEPLERPSARMPHDEGLYRWQGVRELRIHPDVLVSGTLVLYAVFPGGAVSEATTEAQLGLPTVAHRLVGYRAAVLALTEDEESDAATAEGLYQAALDRVTALLGDHDVQGGAALREALLSNEADLYPDML